MATFVHYCPEMVKTSFNQPDLKRISKKLNKKILFSHYLIQSLSWDFETDGADD
jgi:hypothetical protein